MDVLSNTILAWIAGQQQSDVMTTRTSELKRAIPMSGK